MGKISQSVVEAAWGEFRLKHPEKYHEFKNWQRHNDIESEAYENRLERDIQEEKSKIINKILDALKTSSIPLSKEQLHRACGPHVHPMIWMETWNILFRRGRIVEVRKNGYTLYTLPG